LEVEVPECQPDDDRQRLPVEALMAAAGGHPRTWK
jgi:hypothetical protein